MSVPGPAVSFTHFVDPRALFSMYFIWLKVNLQNDASFQLKQQEFLACF